ncbi:hypothetical protein KGD83_19890 [Nocardiopsis akebiae]|uniref:Uncharacterized protein n=1 Tax=Nocardiopsis akebiae TaxID=2831968 RepID=A0ABX8BZS2_9ACTN|nr:hypothetical protein [Nocardiopsis akebiae]QUX27558.1 hypothetical protein KGD83_19890 [Nocardiopsis akebiae]
MTTIRSRALLVVRTLFKLGLLACFLLGALLVAGQLAGVVARRPDWITTTSDLLFVPAVAAAAAFGVLGFLANYLTDDRGGGED